MSFHESKSSPIDNDENERGDPWSPVPPRCLLPGSGLDMASSLSVLVAQDTLGEQYGSGQPSVSSLDEVVLSFASSPGSWVLIAFSESNGAETEPQEKSENWEWVKWRNQEIVVQEESVQEENVEEDEGVGDDTEFTMTVPDLPLTPAVRATTP